MQALRLKSTNARWDLETLDDPRPGPHEVVVQLMASALNRRDYWITQGMYPSLKLPCTLGSDGAGVVQAVGQRVDDAMVGREVVINPGIDWGTNPVVQSSEFRILGMPDNGTFATHVVVPSTHVHPKPQHLSWAGAAALPLAGLTAYRALFTQGELKRGMPLLITGIGGGVASMLLQLANAVGALIVVTSGTPTKIERAKGMGAKVGYLYTNERWHEECISDFGKFDLVVDSAGGAGYGKLLDVAAPGGRIVNFGATTGPVPHLDMFKVFWKQLQLRGTTMGSPDEFTAMLEFVSQHRIQPVVDCILPLREGNEALARLAAHDQFGKVVLAIHDDVSP